MEGASLSPLARATFAGNSELAAQVYLPKSHIVIHFTYLTNPILPGSPLSLSKLDQYSLNYECACLVLVI